MTIIELLEDYDIEYWTEGKNVQYGWVNITCPFCSDDSNHLGIHMKNFRVNCWRCGPKNIIRLLREVIGITSPEAKRIYSSLEGEFGDASPPLSSTITSSVRTKGKVSMSLPQESTIHFPKLHIEYLRSRGFSPRRLIRQFKLRAVENVGKYKFRIVIPVFMKRQLVSFTTRDVTGMQGIPYKMADEDESLLPRNKILFNYDTIPKGGNAMLLEGPMDVMKMGDCAVCAFGVNVSMEQILLLKEKQIQRLFIIFDSPKKDNGVGLRRAKEIAPIIAPLIKKRVEIVTLKTVDDPGELTIDAAKALKAELGFDI